MHQSILKLPAQVTVNQMAGGQLRFHYSGDSVVPLQAALLAFAGSLLETAIAAVQAKKNAELDRQQIPASRLEVIDQELANLSSRRAEVLAQMGSTPAPTSTPPATVEEAMAAAVAAASLVPLAPPVVDPLAHPGIGQVPAPVATALHPGVPQYYVIPSAPAPAAPATSAGFPEQFAQGMGELLKPAAAPAPAAQQALPVIAPTPVHLVPLGP